MNIDNLTVGQAKELAQTFAPLAKAVNDVVNHGFCIAVLDKGFVYVGTVTTDGRFVRITGVQNIRRWGTTNGLGQLALEGPQENTRLDECGDICAPITELKHLITCEASKWTKF